MYDRGGVIGGTLTMIQALFRTKGQNEDTSVMVAKSKDLSICIRMLWLFYLVARCICVSHNMNCRKVDLGSS